MRLKILIKLCDILNKYIISIIQIKVKMLIKKIYHLNFPYDLHNKWVGIIVESTSYSLKTKTNGHFCNG